MNFFQRLKFAFQFANNPNKIRSQHFDFSNWSGNNFWGASNHVISTNETIYSIILRLSNTISALPLNLYQNYEVKNTSVSDLVKVSPNLSMHAFDFLSQLETSRDSKGNGYAMIVRDVYLQPVELIPISADYVTPMINLDDQSLWYKVAGQNQNAIVFNTEIIHVKSLQTIEGTEGISPIRVLKSALEFDGAVKTFNLGEMNKTDSFVVKYERNVDPKKRKALLDDFRNFARDNGGAIFQEKGFTIDQMKRDFQSSDMVNAEKLTRSRIANVFNVPLNFLNESFSEGVSSNEQLMTQFVQMTLLPIVKQYESEFNRKLLTATDRQEGYYFKFNLNGLLRGDTASRTQFYQMMIRNGISTMNGIRGLEDMPPSDEPMANKLFISGDLYPIDLDPSQRKEVKNNDSTKVSDSQAGGATDG
ncbi:phage portal protein [Lactobacillus plantarum]|uniref:phage portal protein n=1 Tax=Lactiplantibacillus plantarum TaxID=1590 RepID=UPI00143D5B84|nr:phage portal protein [Lactiplantibacillus plantarum]MBE1727407.1 phage portal protein [Lactiplantibacillus plantarum]NKI39444.1 phage portal protein [Lactiplantibacillus plantarum]